MLSKLLHNVCFLLQAWWRDSEDVKERRVSLTYRPFAWQLPHVRLSCINIAKERTVNAFNALYIPAVIVCAKVKMNKQINELTIRKRLEILLIRRKCLLF